MSLELLRAWRRWLTLVSLGLALAVFDLEVNGVDLLADTAGHAVLLAAAALLPSELPSGYLRPTLVLAAGAGLLLQVASLLGADVDLALGLALDAVIVSSLLVAVRLATAVQDAGRRRQLRVALAVYVPLALLATAFALVELPLLLGFVVGASALLVVLAVLVLLLLLRRDLQHAAPRQEQVAT